MILTSAQGLGRQYSGDPIFNDLAFEVRAGERIGLVGPNGAGKTTLIRLLAGTDQPDYGQLFVRPGIRISLLQQEIVFAPGETLIDVVKSGLASLIDLRRELEEAAQEMAEAEDDGRPRAGLAALRRAPRSDRAPGRLLDRPSRRGSADGPGLQRGRVSPACDDVLRRPAVADDARQAAAREPRPDAPGRALQPPRYRDDRMARELPGAPAGRDGRREPRPLFPRQGRHQDLGAAPGPDHGLPGQLQPVLAAAHREGQGARAPVRAAGREGREARSVHPQVRRRPARKQAHDRERKLERLERERVETLRDVVGPVMRFDEVERSGDIVVEARKLSKAYDTPLFHDLSLTIDRGECVAVIGPNGSGKTTLIKTLIGREKPDRGEVKLGHKVQVAYHDQGLESLDPDTTVVRAVWPEDDPDWVEGDVRNLLARFGLTGEIVFQTVGQLSGGEKAKAALARLCAVAANLLVMDEPTNHLDIWSREALERSINEFEGTVSGREPRPLFLEQGRRPAGRLVGRPGPRDRGRLRDVSTLDSKRKRARPEGRVGRAPAASRPNSVPAPSDKKKRKFPYRKAVEIEREIGELETAVAELEDQLGQPATWRDPVKAVGTQERHIELKQRLETLYEHWETALEANW